VILVGTCAICVFPKLRHTINSVMIHIRKIEEEVVAKVSCLTAVEGVQGRSNDPREEVRTVNNERRGDQTTSNTSNARKRLRMTPSCLQNDIEAPITLSQSFVPENDLQNHDVTVGYL